MMFDTTCKYCGGECYTDEMQTLEKCKTCFVQECWHKDTVRSYEGSSHHRVRFLEHCINCNAFREYRFYFPTKTKGHMMTLENWDHDEVDLE
jgi:hypothetical protein